MSWCFRERILRDERPLRCPIARVDHLDHEAPFEVPRIRHTGFAMTKLGWSWGGGVSGEEQRTGHEAAPG